MARWQIQRLLAFVSALVACGPMLATPASAATPAECVAASDRAQAQRDDGNLLASRVDFVACAADSCPAIVKRECSRWLAAVDARIPSLVVSVKESSGKDVLDADVRIDGVQLPVSRTGRALKLDPGPHVVRASRRGGENPVEEPFVAREGDRDRVLAIILAPLPASSEQGAGARPPLRRPAPILTWVLGGVAVIGGAGFAYFWGVGVSRVADLRGSCAPYCEGAQIDQARVPLTTAYVSLGLGIAAALGAVSVYLLRPVKPPSSVTTAGRGSPLSVSF